MRRNATIHWMAAAAACLLLAGPAAAKKPAAEASAKPALGETGAEVGKPAPDFTLTDTDGKVHHLADYKGKTVVLEWFNPDCPFVKKHHEKNKTMSATYSKFAGDELVWLAVNSGASGKQGHGLERNRKAREDYGVAYPVLLDESGLVGRLYGAKTTPHMYVIDASGALLYKGAIDDNSSPGTLGETNYVMNCLATLAESGTPEPMETKSYGCSVKYGAEAGVAVP
jgi:peroxiredoxin